MSDIATPTTDPARRTPPLTRAKLALAFGAVPYAIYLGWFILERVYDTGIAPSSIKENALFYGIVAALGAQFIILGSCVAAIGFGASVLASKYRWLGLAAITMGALPLLNYIRIFA